MPKFIDAISQNPNTHVFSVTHWTDGNPEEWELQPLENGLLFDSNSTGFHIIKAINILPDKTTVGCYMDVNIPERINDYAYFVRGNTLVFGYTHKFPGEIIPSQAIDCFGVYELFYSRISPDVGIQVLRDGLAVAKRKHIIAEDLGYILREEQRYREAAGMFQLASDEGPSSYFIYREAAGAFAEIGDVANAEKYEALFKWAESGIEERLARANELLDNAAAELQAMPLTYAQRQELERRFADALARPEAVTPWEEVKARALARKRTS